MERRRLNDRWPLVGMFTTRLRRSAIENQPLIEFVPLHWSMGPQAAAVPKVMTIDQF